MSSSEALESAAHVDSQAQHFDKRYCCKAKTRLGIEALSRAAHCEGLKNRKAFAEIQAR